MVIPVPVLGGSLTSTIESEFLAEGTSGLVFFYPRTIKILTINFADGITNLRQQFLLNYFKALVVAWLGLEPQTSHMIDQRSTN